MFVSLLDSVCTGMYYSIAGNEALIKFIKSKLQGGQVEILSMVILIPLRKVDIEVNMDRTEKPKF